VPAAEVGEHACLPESDSDVAAGRGSLKGDDRFEFSLSVRRPAVDLQQIRLDGDFELPGAGTGRCRTGLTNSMSGFGSSMRIDAAPPRSPFWRIRSAGWLYAGLVALTSTTADEESSSPSSDVKENVAIITPSRIAATL
jgi:hypothetical protein